MAFSEQPREVTRHVALIPTESNSVGAGGAHLKVLRCSGVGPCTVNACRCATVGYPMLESPSVFWNKFWPHSSMNSSRWVFAKDAGRSDGRHLGIAFDETAVLRHVRGR